MKTRMDRFARGVVDIIRMAWVSFYLVLTILFVAIVLLILKLFGLNIFSAAAIVFPIGFAVGCFVEACQIFLTKQSEPPQAQQQRLMSRSIYIPKPPGRPERRRDDRRQ